MTLSVVDPFPSVSVALAAARALDDRELCQAIWEAEEALRRLQAQTVVLHAELGARIEAMGYPIAGAAEELATMLHISPRSADHRLDAAEGLCDRQVVWSALSQARIDLAKARLIVDLLAHVPDPRREDLELAAIEYAAAHTGHQLRRRLLAWTV